MLNRDELVDLYRELRDENVLSVYLDGKTNDFSERNLWRRRLEGGVGEARRRVHGSNEGEAKTFDRAVGQVERALENYDHFLPDRGWVGFATPERLVHGAPVRVPMPDLVRWERGIRAAPYVRALKQDRLVVAVLVDQRRARIFEYRAGELAEPLNLNAETFLGDLSDIRMSKRATSHSGVRGATATDAAQRFLGVGSERMMKSLMELASDRAGGEGHLVVGGPPEAVAAAVAHLPSGLKDRCEEESSLRLEMSNAQVRDSIEEAASRLNGSIQARLLQEVLDQARSGGRGALGPEGAEKALKEGRVDTLLLSRGFIAANPDYADHLVGAAFQQHGEVEELSFDGADRLDSAGEGVAARLRYTVSD